MKVGKKGRRGGGRKETALAQKYWLIITVNLQIKDAERRKTPCSHQRSNMQEHHWSTTASWQYPE